MLVAEWPDVLREKGLHISIHCVGESRRHRDGFLFSARTLTGPLAPAPIPARPGRLRTAGLVPAHPPLSMKTPAMADQGTTRTSPRSAAADRRPWVAPRVEDLPRLTDLTLQTTPIEGTCGTGGSTCF